MRALFRVAVRHRDQSTAICASGVAAPALLSRRLQVARFSVLVLYCMMHVGISRRS